MKKEEVGHVDYTFLHTHLLLTMITFVLANNSLNIISKDARLEKLDSGRSINLALSARGIAALTAAGVEADILTTLIPMKGRMIHSSNGKIFGQNYGVYGEVDLSQSIYKGF